jgi:hypothetical protein
MVVRVWQIEIGNVAWAIGSNRASDASASRTQLS